MKGFEKHVFKLEKLGFITKGCTLLESIPDLAEIIISALCSIFR